MKIEESKEQEEIESAKKVAKQRAADEMLRQAQVAAEARKKKEEAKQRALEGS